jgi:hypothetical protein
MRSVTYAWPAFNPGFAEFIDVGRIAVTGPLTIHKKPHGRLSIRVASYGVKSPSKNPTQRARLTGSERASQTPLNHPPHDAIAIFKFLSCSAISIIPNIAQSSSTLTYPNPTSTMKAYWFDNLPVRSHPVAKKTRLTLAGRPAPSARLRARRRPRVPGKPGRNLPAHYVASRSRRAGRGAQLQEPRRDHRIAGEDGRRV